VRIGRDVGLSLAAVLECSGNFDFGWDVKADARMANWGGSGCDEVVVGRVDVFKESTDDISVCKLGMLIWVSSRIPSAWSVDDRKLCDRLWRRGDDSG
jgi:hypothetical protein